MKDKYLLFLGDLFYPSGGWMDLVGVFDSFSEARDVIESISPFDRWFHVVFNGKIIAKGQGTLDDDYKDQWEVE